MNSMVILFAAGWWGRKEHSWSDLKLGLVGVGLCSSFPAPTFLFF